ncbi:hypothetical protein D3C71_1429290 [compost metagenome]
MDDLQRDQQPAQLEGAPVWLLLLRGDLQPGAEPGRVHVPGAAPSIRGERQGGQPGACIEPCVADRLHAGHGAALSLLLPPGRCDVCRNSHARAFPVRGCAHAWPLPRLYSQGVAAQGLPDRHGAGGRGHIAGGLRRLHRPELLHEQRGASPWCRHGYRLVGLRGQRAEPLCAGFRVGLADRSGGAALYPEPALRSLREAAFHRRERLRGAGSER